MRGRLIGVFGVGLAVGAGLAVFAFLVAINDDDAALALARFLRDDVMSLPTSP